MNVNQMRLFSGQRKHHTQMNEVEKQGIVSRLNKIKPIQWRLSYHCMDRISEKKINVGKEFITDMINNSDIVEYRILDNARTGGVDERVVLSSKTLVDGKWKVKVVYSLNTGVVITAWVNHKDDHHSTLDWNLYEKDMVVFGV